MLVLGLANGPGGILTNWQKGQNAMEKHGIIEPPLETKLYDDEGDVLESQTFRVRELQRAEEAYRVRFSKASTNREKALAFIAYAQEVEWVERFYR